MFIPDFRLSQVFGRILRLLISGETRGRIMSIDGDRLRMTPALRLCEYARGAFSGEPPNYRRFTTRWEFGFCRFSYNLILHFAYYATMRQEVSAECLRISNSGST